MSNRVRQFLKLGGTRSAGRWFAAVLAIGFLELMYLVIAYWSTFSTWQRARWIAGVIIAAGLTIAYVMPATRYDRSKNVEPTA